MHIEGLSQEADEDVIFTDEGEIAPRSAGERWAAEKEAAVEDEDAADDGGPATRVSQRWADIEDEQEEAVVRTRRAPQGAHAGGAKKA